MSIRNYWNEWGGMIHFWSGAFQPHVPQPCPPPPQRCFVTSNVSCLAPSAPVLVFLCNSLRAALRCGRASEMHCSGRVAVGWWGGAGQPATRPPPVCAPSHITRFRWHLSCGNTCGSETQEYKTGNFIVTCVNFKVWPTLFVQTEDEE